MYPSPEEVVASRRRTQLFCFALPYFIKEMTGARYRHYAKKSDNPFSWVEQFTEIWRTWVFVVFSKD